MYKIFHFCVLFILPFVKCNFAGLNIQRGTCPVIQGDPNFNLQQFCNGVWTVSQRSTNLNAGDKDCQNFAFIPEGNNLHVFTLFSNSDTELTRAFQAHTMSTTPGVFSFIRSFLRDNLILKGTLSVPATDNNNFAVCVQCDELLGFRIITIYVLIKGATAPPNLDQLVTQSLARNGLALSPPLIFRGLEAKCSINN